MHPSWKEASSAGGHTSLPFPGHKQQDDKCATDSAVDSGFHSGQNLSFSSSSEVQEAPVQQTFHSGSQKVQVQQFQEQDSQNFDSGCGLDSSQQSHSNEGPMKVEDLCQNMQRMQLQRQKHQEQKLYAAQQFEQFFQQNDEGDTYLHLAVIHEAAEVAFKLIEVAPRPWLDIQNDIGQTPLHLSVLIGHPALVRRLVVAGAQTSIRDIEGNTALHLACLHRRTDCAKELLTPLELQHSSSAVKIPQDLEQWNYNGKRCVHIAAETSNIEILRYLVSAGADINSREGKSGLTPLHIAIESSNEQLVNFLLDQCPKLRLEQVTYAGLTAYQLAALQRNEKLLKGLVTRGAEPLTPPESEEEDDDSEEDEQ